MIVTLLKALVVLGLLTLPIKGYRTGGLSPKTTDKKELAATTLVSLDSDWQFSTFDNPSEFATINIPHTVAPLSWHNWNPSSWEQVFHYSKGAFDLPSDTPADSRYILRFEGVLTGATPTLNGHKLAQHLGGYVPFEYEVTSSITKTGNKLDVDVDGHFTLDVPPGRPGQGSNSIDFWQPAGIYRSVNLLIVPKYYISDVFAKPTNVLDANGRYVEVDTTINAADKISGSIQLQLNDGNTVISTSRFNYSTTASGDSTVVGRLSGLGNVQLWGISSPKLYSLTVTLFVGTVNIHSYQTNIGFRHTEFTTRGFFLNGQRVQLMGLNRHQFFPFAGAAMPHRIQRRDAQILKENGANVVRCSHYPQHPAFLDACDELGLLVWEEAPGWQYIGDDAWKQLSVRDVQAMITRDRNHPSVILWGVRLNETPDNTGLYTATQQAAKKYDPTRNTTGALLGGNCAHESDYQQDVMGCNDYSGHSVNGSWYPNLGPARSDYAYLVSETVAEINGPAKFYRRTDRVIDQMDQSLAHAFAQDQGIALSGISGVIGWSAFDYATGNGANQANGVKYCGVMDEFHIPKFGVAVYTAQVPVSERVVIEPAFYWYFQSGSPLALSNLGTQAYIWSNADRIELSVNGNKFATLMPDTSLFGKLPHPPFVANFASVSGAGNPVLHIAAYVGSNLIGSRNYSSNTAMDKFVMAADDASIVADGADTTRVVFRVVDMFGAPRPSLTGSVSFQLVGPATLIGDNPFPLGDVGGVAAVWVRSASKGSTGNAVLTAKHSSLGTAQVTIDIK